VAKEVIMPKFGFTQETAEIVKWLKHEGDAVEAGDLIAEVTTDKVNMDVESMEDGILAGLKYKEGDIVPVATVIAYILKPGESLPSKSASAASSPTPQPASAPPVISAPPSSATPVALRVAQELNVDISKVSGSGIGGRITREDVESYAQKGKGKISATPAARRIAREQGVNLSSITGSGPNGRVQGEDVSKIKTGSVSSFVVEKAAEKMDDFGVVPMSSIRRTIANRLQQSSQQAPHIFFDAEVDITALEALRQQANQRDMKISLTALIARIVAWALTKHPYINSQLDGTNILLMKNVNIGVAVALDNGLIVPVIRNADKKSVFNISNEISLLAEKARQNNLKPDDLTEGTFTISNLGMFGVDRFTAIINPPQSAILAVSRAVKKFVPDENGQPVLHPMMTITLSADHRVIDGAIAAQFLSDLRNGLEQPEIIIL
jgi:pyruvate dehydrogenase E2 component (dihydrolipoamide acetyltransferase)